MSCIIDYLKKRMREYVSNHLCNRDARTYRSKRGLDLFLVNFFFRGIGCNRVELSLYLISPFFNTRRIEMRERETYCAEPPLIVCRIVFPLMGSGCWEISGPMKGVHLNLFLFSFHCRSPIVCAGTVWKRTNKIVRSCDAALCIGGSRETSLIGLYYSLLLPLSLQCNNIKVL
jgi:hypothetical protein